MKTDKTSVTKQCLHSVAELKAYAELNAEERASLTVEEHKNYFNSANAVLDDIDTRRKGKFKLGDGSVNVTATLVDNAGKMYNAFKGKNGEQWFITAQNAYAIHRATQLLRTINVEKKNEITSQDYQVMLVALSAQVIGSASTASCIYNTQLMFNDVALAQQNLNEEDQIASTAATFAADLVEAAQTTVVDEPIVVYEDECKVDPNVENDVVAE